MKLAPSPIDEQWDALVIGAGVAGSVVARALANQGQRTLLVDAKTFPRDKVCGGCLSARAVQMLQTAGLDHILTDLEAVPLDHVQFIACGRQARVSMPPGLGVSRRALDARLLAAAIDAGVEARLGLRAEVLPIENTDERRVRLVDHRRHAQYVAAKVVIAADGLGHPSLAALPEWQMQVTRSSRVGLGAVVRDAALYNRVAPRRITMVVGRRGYIGLARCEGQQISVASAIDRRWLAECHSSAVAMQSLLDEAGADIVLPDHIHWVGTRPLTQASPRLADHRLFVIGDAASYVEPFTGEGMTAALRGAELLAPLAAGGCDVWSASLVNSWTTLYRQQIVSSQRVCRSLAWMLRHPRAVNVAIRAASLAPLLGRQIAHRVHAVGAARVGGTA